MMRRLLAGVTRARWRGGSAELGLERRASSAAAAPTAYQQLPAGLDAWAGFSVGVEQAPTLPASWYTHPAVLELEQRRVLHNSWQAVCAVDRLRQPGDYVCGTLGSARYLVVRGEDGQLRAFHNVCRHHAAAVAQGCGHREAPARFSCPYHGWTYDDRGRLVKATRLRGIQDFRAADHELRPIALDVWGPLVFLHLGAPPAGVAQWLGAGGARLAELGMADASLVHVARREYDLACNWKCFNDNYLDGGYHVEYAHPALAAGLDGRSYTNELHEVLSVQRCGVKAPRAPAQAQPQPHDGAGAPQQAPLDRLGERPASYAFVFPTLMLNRYGPWLDSNVVLPLGVDRCRVVFDWWLEAGALRRAAATVDGGAAGAADEQPGAEQQPPPPGVVQAALRSAFVADSLASSHQVQVEDIALCEAVQAGLAEPSYTTGRYAPGPEAPMHHFHRLLYGAALGLAVK